MSKAKLSEAQLETILAEASGMAWSDVPPLVAAYREALGREHLWRDAAMQALEDFGEVLANEYSTNIDQAESCQALFALIRKHDEAQP